MVSSPVAVHSPIEGHDTAANLPSAEADSGTDPIDQDEPFHVSANGR